MDAIASTTAESGPGEIPGERHYLRLIGQPVLNTGRDEHPLAAERRHQLLAYLACREGWVPRSEIAELFWEDRADGSARRNLRRLLHDVRRIPWIAGLESRNDALRWRVPSDLANFDRACSARDWDRSVRLGSGLLLAGLEKGATEPFHAWLRNEREAQLSRWRESLARRREELHADPQARAELARFALAHDPCNESMLAELMEALRACGREADAQEAWRQFASRLKDELGIEPQLRIVEAAPARSRAAPAQQPAGAGPGLIGRRLEQSRLAETLRQPECRRATLIGPGGVGKSSLAASAQALLSEDFPDGVRWVGLRDLAHAAQVPARIAEACGFKGALAHDPLAGLAARIGASRMLLVLDNCEHLAEVGAIGDVLVERCPNLKILHASRARIGCAGEWMLPLAGLAVPDADEAELEVLRTFDSVRLFEARARQCDPGFDSARCIGDIAALVRMVEGLPLAIEMAAACTRLLPLSEIVRDLSRLLDLRATSSALPGAAPSAERSLRASFEQSWRLLSQAERRMLAQLAVFNGGFSLAAAERVAGADLPAIATLADKSLVATGGDGRFSLHPLIREFAREHLADEPVVRARHAAHYCDVLVARAHAATAATVPWAHEDVSHCLEAWHWASAAADTRLLLRMAIPLVRLFNRYLRWQEGIAAIEGTLASLEGRATPVERLRAQLAYGLAVCRFYNGEIEAAEASARSSLRLCRALRIREEIPAASLYIIGAALGWRGESARARRYLERGLGIARSLGEHESVVKAIYGIAFLEQAAGRWAHARELYAQAEALGREHAAHQWHALSLNGMGACWLAEGRVREALDCFERGIRVCTEHEVHGRRSFLLANRGLALLRQGDCAEAARSIERAVRESQEWSICTAGAEALVARSALGIARGDLEAARGDLRTAMEVALKIQSPLRRMPVVRQWGQWLLAAGRREEGAQVLEFVRAHAMSPRMDQDAAGESLALLASAAGPRRVRGSLTLAALEAEILARR